MNWSCWIPNKFLAGNDHLLSTSPEQPVGEIPLTLFMVGSLGFDHEGSPDQTRGRRTLDFSTEDYQSVLPCRNHLEKAPANNPQFWQKVGRNYRHASGIIEKMTSQDVRYDTFHSIWQREVVRSVSWGTTFPPSLFSNSRTILSTRSFLDRWGCRCSLHYWRYSRSFVQDWTTDISLVFRRRKADRKDDSKQQLIRCLDKVSAASDRMKE